VPGSCTDVIGLLGADGFAALRNQRAQLSADSGLHEARIEHLLSRYGSRIFELLDQVAERPELGRALPGAEAYLQVEVRHAATHEAARHLDDVLTRRTRISIETWDRGLAAAEPAARLMGEVLEWDENQVRREIELYHARVRAERASQAEPDDRAADVARTSAPDVLADAQPTVPAPGADPVVASGESTPTQNS
jgi:glycerol-3-phosphate dehydrogenase